MKLVVGLGNPGNAYANNRHNIGFRIVDLLACKLGFPKWQSSSAFMSTKGKIESIPVVLVKPTTYMNNSGMAVLEASKFFKIRAHDIFVFHDDLNIDWGIIRKKVGGGHGGHNGLRSISELIGKEYKRVRIGIGRPENDQPVAKYVLSSLNFDQETKINDVLEFCLLNIMDLMNKDAFLTEGIDILSGSCSG
tara:strand:- start:770 stop:1345 length:576 start_codon:yes stop_codon:yes gene_type:complete